MSVTILYVEGCRDGTVGGSHTCLYSMVANLDRSKYHPIVVFYDEHVYAERLRALGVDVHILEKWLPLDLIGSGERERPLSTLRRGLLPFQKAVNFARIFLKPAMACRRFIRNHQVDVVHLNNSLNTNHEWMLAAKFAGAKLVSHERGISPSLSRTARALGRIADRIVCMARVIREPLVAQGLDASKVVVIYDGIDPERVAPRRSVASVKASLGIDDADPVIGMVGNIKEWKGQETVIRALEHLARTRPNVRCVLVGGASSGDAYKERLENLVAALGLEGNVYFVGFQDHPFDFMSMMDIVVHASLQAEPFGMVNLEAMSLGKPVVSTSVGGPTEVFNDGVDGVLIEPGKPAELAGALDRLLGDPGLRERLGKAARGRVSDDFTIQRTVSQIERIYDELVGSAGA